MKKIGLVAVGVNKTGILDLLNGAAQGAIDFSNWLENQKNFSDVEVCKKVLTDADGTEVTIVDVQNAVNELLTEGGGGGGGFDLLILFFSGHGFVKSGGDELLLLSNIHKYIHEAISIVGTIANAYKLPINHVIIISDACRNQVALDSGLAEKIGIPAFETGFTKQKIARVDVFYATEVSQTAKEYGGNGFFTQILLEALNSSPHVVCEALSNGRLVITSEKVKKYLDFEVPTRANIISENFDQTPDIYITSALPQFFGYATEASLKSVLLEYNKTTVFDQSASENVYFSRRAIRKDKPDVIRVREDLHSIAVPIVRNKSRLVNAKIKSKKSVDGFVIEKNKPELKIRKIKKNEPQAIEVFNRSKISPRNPLIELNDFFSNSESITLKNPNLKRYLKQLKIYDEVNEYVLKSKFENINREQSIYKIYGDTVDEVIISDDLQKQIKVEIKKIKYGSHISLEFRSNTPILGRSMIVSLSNGISTVLPIMVSYVGTVLIKNSRVNAIHFDSSVDESLQKEVLLRRAIISKIAIKGKLRHLVDQTDFFADFVRSHKEIDPTLGIYGSYAYALSGNFKGAKSIYKWLHKYRGYYKNSIFKANIIFDNAMLAGILVDDRKPNTRIAPFCPMMTIGWSMISSYINEIHPAIKEASYKRLNSEWIAFRTTDIKDLITALKKGELR